MGALRTTEQLAQAIAAIDGAAQVYVVKHPDGTFSLTAKRVTKAREMDEKTVMLIERVSQLVGFSVFTVITKGGKLDRVEAPLWIG